MPEMIYIRNYQSPGDYIVMSAMIRDLHKAYPGKYQTMVNTLQPAIFDMNPYVSHFVPRPGMKIYTAQYSNRTSAFNIHRCNEIRTHFLWGFIGDLNLYLKTKVVLTEFKPDLHLSEQEKQEPLIQKPYWLFASGGKMDFTAKWWDPVCWRAVVDAMKPWMNMVQIGGGSHVHPLIDGAIDLVGKTSFRDLMRLIYHAEGVLCAVTCYMHIAAAFNKPCVIVAGGREGWWWESYTEENRIFNLRVGDPNWKPPPNDNFIPQKYLHTLGQLPCCKDGGCWRSFVTSSDPRKNCTASVLQGGKRLPKCMQLITPQAVLEAVQWYYDKGILSKTGAGAPQSILIPPTLVAKPAVSRPQLSSPVLAAIQAQAQLRLAHPPAHTPIRIQRPVYPSQIRMRQTMFAPSSPLVPKSSPQFIKKIALYFEDISWKSYLGGLALPELPTLVLSTTEDEERRKFCLERGWECASVPGRREALQCALDSQASDHILWLESIVKPKLPDWLQPLNRLLDSGKAAGVVSWDNITSSQEQTIKGASWYRGRDFEKRPLQPNAARVYYFERGFAALPVAVLRAARWKCSDVAEEELDIMLGEALRQLGVGLADAGGIMEYLR